MEAKDIFDTENEAKFLRKIFFLSAFVFLSSSIIPQITVPKSSFASSIDNDIRYMIDDDLMLLEDGFVNKPEIRTEIGDRSDVGGIIEYKVKDGDSLSAIASKFGITQKTIVHNNPSINTKKLIKNTIIKIPVVNGIIHNVKKNETVDTIAKKYGIKVDRIIIQNGIADNKLIFENQKLIIPDVYEEIAVKNYKERTEVSSSGTIKETNISRNNNKGGVLLKPCKGSYTQYYHYGHYAVDIATPGGAPIYAATDGTVVKSSYGWNGGYGNVIVIDHGGGMKTLYGHNKEIYVKVGDKVRRGDPISYMGNSGRVFGKTGIHLHFEVIVNGTKKNPLVYF